MRMLSSVGANKNAKRAAMVHLSFNVIGTAVCLVIFCLAKAIFAPVILDTAASLFGIAVIHSAFNVLCTAVMLPFTQLLEKLVCRIIPETVRTETKSELDERLLLTPPVALNRAKEVAAQLAELSAEALQTSVRLLEGYSAEKAEQVRHAEEQADHFEDILGTYLVRLSTKQISSEDSMEAAKLLKIIGDCERISDHAVSITGSAEELRQKELALSVDARKELGVLTAAVEEIVGLTLRSFLGDDQQSAHAVEPLEQVIDGLKERLRTNHIRRLQQEQCSIEAGFVWSDLLTDLERVADHCSNIAGCVIDMRRGNLNLHETLRAAKLSDRSFAETYREYEEKYRVAAV